MIRLRRVSSSDPARDAIEDLAFLPTDLATRMRAVMGAAFPELTAADLVRLGAAVGNAVHDAVIRAVDVAEFRRESAPAAGNDP